MHYEILDKKRIEFLHKLKTIAKDPWYLAGGTALALHLGHRDSIDFDFFQFGSFNPDTTQEEIERVFIDETIIVIDKQKNTLSLLVDGVNISFMTFPYSMVNDFEYGEYCNVASVLDIGCMKLNAITSRSVLKDYIDLYEIFKQYSFAELVNACSIKMPSLDENVMRKALIYFDDILMEEVIFKSGFKVTLDDIKKKFQALLR